MKCWVGFSYHDSMLSKLIAAKMGKGYSHTFIVFEWNGELVVLHATGKGVNAVSWENFKSKNKIVKLIEQYDQDKINLALKYCISKLGIKYGFLAIIAIGLGIHYEDGEKTLICSEYVARAFNLSINKLVDLITPADIELNI